MKKTSKLISICLLVVAVFSLGAIGCQAQQNKIKKNESEIAIVLENFNKQVSKAKINDLYSNLYSSISDNESNNFVKQIKSNTNDIKINGLETDSIVYDFKERPVYLLCEFSGGGYAIVNRLTGNSMERTDEGNSPYKAFGEVKKYYGGFSNYFIKTENKVIDIKLSEEVGAAQQEFYVEMSEYLSIGDAIGYDAETDTIEEKNSGLSKMTTNTERENYSTIMPGGEYFLNLKLNYTSNSMFEADSAYYNKNGRYDMLYPENDGSSCGIVAIVQLMQFYERRGTQVIPDVVIPDNVRVDKMDYSEYKDKNFWQTITAQRYFSQELHNQIDAWTPHGAFGENTTINLVDGINNIYNFVHPTILRHYYHIIPDYNMCYNNMVDAIANGRPAIGMTTSGNGYYKQNGTWVHESVYNHQMVAYGYCTTKKGTLQDFICHSGWYINGSEKMYVYKLNFLSNFTHTLQYK